MPAGVFYFHVYFWQAVLSKKEEFRNAVLGLIKPQITNPEIKVDFVADKKDPQACAIACRYDLQKTSHPSKEISAIKTAIQDTADTLGLRCYDRTGGMFSLTKR